VRAKDKVIPKMKTSFTYMIPALAALACAAAFAAEPPLEQNPAYWPQGWKVNVPVKTYDSKTLFELIDGEAELYFPYGFKRCYAIQYDSATNPDDSATFEVYEQGTLLDAFGVYSNFREADSKLVELGAEGFAGSTNVVFYQDRYFVKGRLSGKVLDDKEGLLTCAKEVSKGIFPNTAKPAELGLLKVAGIVPRTEQYIAQSLLGYECFTRGLIANATLDGKTVRVFIVMTDSPKAAEDVLTKYQDYLKTSKAENAWKETPNGKVLTAQDPLHKGMLLQQVGKCVVGICKLVDPSLGQPLLDQLAAKVRANSK